MPTGHLTVHTENLLPIIKKWLYSDKDIFVRELIANSCDAIHKLKILWDSGDVQMRDDELRIDIAIDKEGRTLTFSDNGIGMDAGEVEKYICQLAFSGAEEFLTKYQSNKEGDQIIGHFGLGFFSAFMVASKVEIQTLSYRPDAEPVHWQSQGGADYDMERGTRTTRGTSVILHIDQENGDFLDAEHLRKTLNHYCAFLPYPIYLGDERINRKAPLWMKAPSACTDAEYIEFYHFLYPGAEDPLFWVHLNVDYPFHLKGILYFPKIQRQTDLTHYSVKLFCNRVFVSDNCKDLIPDYLMVLRGALDSPDIPLNVSRSYLQMDRTVRQLGMHISKKVSDTLSTLYQNDRERFLRSWRDISPIIKLGAVEDEKFYEKTKNLLLWKSVKGDWMTVEEYLERNQDKAKDKVLYTAHEMHAPHLLEAYAQKGLDVLVADGPVDPYLIHFLERKLPSARFQRIDAAVDESLVDASREKTILDAAGKTEAGRLADFVRAKLGNDLVDVQAKSLAADSLPAIITVDEEARRLREYMQRVNPEDTSLQEHLPEKRTLVVNTNSSLLSAIAKLDATDPELAQELVVEVYELALLAQRELKPQQLNGFVQRSQRVLEKLARQKGV
jgi:molecular chaperone HtpG